MLLERIGRAAMLEQVAEECSELAHACLKYARYLRNENPTNKNIIDIQTNLEEEAADVKICLKELEAGGLINKDNVSEWKEKKIDRMSERFKQKFS